jgi:hypothetical protein
VVRYPASGGFYREHLDTSFSRMGGWAGEKPGRSQLEGERVTTTLVVTSDGFGGGATYFPRWKLAMGGGVSDDGSPPAHPMKRGDALLFWSLDDEGEIDEGSTHAGQPTFDPAPPSKRGQNESGDAASGGGGHRKSIVNFWHREKRWWGFSHF